MEVQEATPSLLYTLNRDHVAAPAVLALADIRSEFIRRIRDHVRTWELRPVSVAVFGSMARGDGDVESDVDVFVVRPDQVDGEDVTWRKQVSDLSDAIARWSGNRASMIEVSVREARGMQDRLEPVVDELARDAVHIAGRPVADLLGGSIS
ncbi:nucleotidyltransferase domain-containing protein [Jiangella asiatica]|uniref:nucleotidyltransferase domain-containing protein n=1 Tax=Jiangella asiatica TaxID=2530372 RepID=UPI0013A5EF08|nr:nucleotidyltransferase domain-containing protein [Jiangella asiatica]